MKKTGYLINMILRMSLGCVSSILVISICMGPHYALAGPVRVLPKVKKITREKTDRKKPSYFDVLDMSSVPKAQQVAADGRTYQLEPAFHMLLEKVGRYLCEEKNDPRCDGFPVDHPRSDYPAQVYDQYNKDVEHHVGDSSEFDPYISTRNHTKAQRLSNAGDADAFKDLGQGLTQVDQDNVDEKAARIFLDHAVVAQAGFVPIAFVDLATTLSQIGEGFASAFDQTVEGGFLAFLEEVWVSAAIGAGAPLASKFVMPALTELAMVFGWSIPSLAPALVTFLLICVSVLFVSIAVEYFIWRTRGEGKGASVKQCNFHIGQLLFTNLRDLLVALLAGGTTYGALHFKQMVTAAAGVLGKAGKVFQGLVNGLQRLLSPGVQAAGNGNVLLFRQTGTSVPIWSGKYAGVPKGGPPMPKPPAKPIGFEYVLAAAAATLPPKEGNFVSLNRVFGEGFSDAQKVGYLLSASNKPYRAATSSVQPWGDEVSKEEQQWLQTYFDEWMSTSPKRPPTDQQLLDDIKRSRPLRKQHVDLLKRLTRGGGWLANWACMRLLELIGWGYLSGYVEVGNDLYDAELLPIVWDVQRTWNVSFYDDALAKRARRLFITYFLTDAERKQLGTIIASGEALDVNALLWPSMQNWVVISWYLRDNTLLDRPDFVSYVEAIVEFLIAGNLFEDVNVVMAVHYLTRFAQDSHLINRALEARWIGFNFGPQYARHLVEYPQQYRAISAELLADVLQKLESDLFVSGDRAELLRILLILQEYYYISEMEQNAYGLSSRVQRRVNFKSMVFEFRICLLFTENGRNLRLGIISTGGERRTITVEELAGLERLHRGEDLGQYILQHSRTYDPSTDGQMLSLRNGHIRPWIP